MWISSQELQEVSNPQSEPHLKDRQNPSHKDKKESTPRVGEGLRTKFQGLEWVWQELRMVGGPDVRLFHTG